MDIPAPSLQPESTPSFAMSRHRNRDEYRDRPDSPGSKRKLLLRRALVGRSCPTLAAPHPLAARLAVDPAWRKRQAGTPSLQHHRPWRGPPDGPSFSVRHTQRVSQRPLLRSTFPTTDQPGPQLVMGGEVLRRAGIALQEQ